MDDESTTAPAAEEASAAPVTEAAPSEAGAPASPPEDGFEKRYNDLRTEFDRRNSLLDRVRQGDLDAARELQLEFAEEEQPDTTGYEEEPDPISALEQQQQQFAEWVQQREAQDGMARFNADLDRLLGEHSLKVAPRERLAIWTETVQRGDGPEVLKAVVDEIAQEHKTRDQAVIDRYRQSKRAPHVSRSGTGATEMPFREDMSLDERIAAAQELARLRSSEQ